jgi:hypothetical protein
LAAEPATEFRPYRRALQGILASVTILAVVYLLTSIAVSVFAKRRVHLKGKPIQAENIDDVLACQADVERLFHELAGRTFELCARPSRAKADLGEEWESFSQKWHDDWAEVGGRCRFLELRDRGLGADFDRLAWAHDALEDVKYKLAAILRAFADGEGREIAAIRHSLEASRQGLVTRKRAMTPPQAHGAGMR